ncbi:MAG: acetate--CoA ligase family protein [Planctomycetes bacterium]|nr:acetate--CoA ligase family protein [Planctomycetota bacterium]
MLKYLFNPKSIAVIGASRESGKLGHIVLRNIILSKFDGKVYPVNPSAKRILTLKCYPSASDIPGNIDMAVFSIPAPYVLPALKDCISKRAKAGIIITAGFKETGPQGAAMEKEIQAVAKKYGISLIGPNCVGLISTSASMNATFSITPKIPRQGEITFFSQSGALAMGILDWTIKERIGLSKLISLGNKIDVDEIKLLKHLENDPQTKVILGYLEGIEHGIEFMKIGRKVSRKKPIIMVKGGTTKAGARAVSSHTGSLAGRDAAYQAAFRQSGIIRVNTLLELFDAAKAFIKTKLLKGPNIGIVTNSGGPAILAADALEKSPVLELAPFGNKTVETLRRNLPPGVAIYNPVDLIADADKARYTFAINTVLKDPKVDGVLVIYTPATSQLPPAQLAHTIIKLAHKSPKPIFAVFMGGEFASEGIKILSAAHFPYYQMPEQAIFAFEAAMRYYNIRQQPVKQIIKRFSVNKPLASKIINTAIINGHSQLGAEAALKIFGAYGIKVPQNLIARTANEAGQMVKQIGFPVVMKIVSPDIIHKSDVNGVRLNIADAEEAKVVFDEIIITAQSRVPSAQIEGVSIQKMVTGGKEIIIGMTRDPQFGPLLMFGLGGIYVETLKDVSFRVLPLTEPEALSMIKEIKSYPILSGVRGEARSDIDAIKETILRLAELVTDFPQISELDINPFKVFEDGKGGMALDARLSLKGADWL